MKKYLVIMLVAAMAIVPFAATDSLAAVAGTEHDIVSGPASGTVSGWGGQGICSYCHVPHSAQGARLWAASPLASVPVYGAAVVAGLCYTCHDGLGSTASDHTGTVYNAALTNHPLADGGLTPDTDQTGTGWPFTATQGDTMECTSCHNPHDNTLDNFARAAFHDGTTSPNDGQFCDACHQNRNDEGYENVTGTHPAGDATVPGAKYGAPAGVVDLTVVGPNGGSFQNAQGTEGGHLSGYTTGGVVCMTCHRPHGAPDGPVVTETNADAANAYNVLCEMCHGVLPSLQSATDTESVHPVDAGTEDQTTANGLVVILNNTNWDLNLTGATAGNAGEIVCLSCHDPHGANPGTPILRVELNSPGDGICNDCHSDLPVAGGNHPVGVPITNEDGADWPNKDALPLYGAGSNEVWCETCHAPHDGAAGANYLLAVTEVNDAICVGCHTDTASGAALAGVGGTSANPSAYIDNEGYTGSNAAVGAGLGTHAAYRAIDVANNAGWAVALTTARGDTSDRSNDYGASGTDIVCGSCHVVHGANIPGGWHGTAGSENLLFLENGLGNARTGPDGGAAAYDPADDSYCSACHATGTNPVAPEGTHPVQSWTVSRTAAPLNINTGSFADVFPPLATSDYTTGAAASAVMTCESCHAPHAAATNMGSFILEGGTAGGSATGGETPGAGRNRDDLCDNCHAY